MSRGANFSAQLEQLRAAGCQPICREKVTGARADRRELLKLLKAIGPGDVVTVARIDRLGRSTFDLFAIVKQSVSNLGGLAAISRVERRESRIRAPKAYRLCSAPRSYGAGGEEMAALPQ